MPSALAWKALPTVNLSAISSAGYVAALNTLFSSTNYADGTARTSATAWTPTLLSDGTLKCTAPGNSLGLIAHIGEASALSTLPRSFGESATNNGGKVLGTIVLNPGTYNPSNLTAPWGSTARCFGYCYMSPMYVVDMNRALSSTYMNASGFGANSAVTAVQVRAWESADAIVIHAQPNAGGSGTAGSGALYILGGWLAPDVSASGTEDAETDEILYGIVTSGHGAAWVNSYNSNFYNISFDTANYSGMQQVTALMMNNPDTTLTNLQKVYMPHCGVFVPGTSQIVEVNRMGTFRPGVTSQLVTPSQKFVRMPIYFSSSDKFMGRAREMWMFRRSLNGLVLRSGGSGGVDRGHIISFNNTGVCDSFILSV